MCDITGIPGHESNASLSQELREKGPFFSHLLSFTPALQRPDNETCLYSLWSFLNYDFRCLFTDSVAIR